MKATGDDVEINFLHLVLTRAHHSLPLIDAFCVLVCLCSLRPLYLIPTLFIDIYTYILYIFYICVYLYGIYIHVYACQNDRTYI